MKTQQITRSTVDNQHLPDVVQQAFSDIPCDAQATLLAIRKLIFAAQQSDAEVGELQEVLRWGQLTYLTKMPNTGSMIRLALNKSGEPAVFFHCGTSLVETFRAQYSHLFEFEGNRALVLRRPVEGTVAELTHCLKQALRYKLDGGSSL